MLACKSMLVSVDRFRMDLKAYLEQTLHMSVDVRRYEALRGLPAYLSHLYTLYAVHLRDIPFVVLASFEPMPLLSEVRKHMEVVRSVAGQAVAFAAPALSAPLRSRLIREGVSFIVPGNQLYLPELAVDLREHFRAARRVDHDALTPAAQALVFYHLLRPGDPLATPSRIARDLGYSAMTVGRAFDDLVAHGLANSERKGKSRYICFKFDGRALFDAAKAYVRSPVRAVKFLKGRQADGLPLAGESALSMRSDLAPPRLKTFAIPAAAWKVFLRGGGRKEADDRDDADYAVETWSYDPRALSDGATVDLLSLHVQFKDSADERVAAAAESLLEEIRW